MSRPDGWVPIYIADGHTIDVIITNGGYEARLSCPGEGKCHAAVSDAEGNPKPPFECNLTLWFEDAGMEFLEWQDKPYEERRMPCEIEWRYEGYSDSAEIFWRPRRIYTADEIAEIATLAAGAATAPLMALHPDTEMPSEEVLRGVNAVLREKRV